ncbi:MAG: cupin domain-containing protein [Alphaproteobacteria bacterium]
MTKPIALVAADGETRKVKSNYPEPFYSRVAGRQKRVLGNVFGLENFGVNQTTLAPGSQSALLHKHSKQDEFIYILSGEGTLVTDQGEARMTPGMCAGFPAAGLAHHLVNNSEADVVYLEIGDRTKGDGATYPNDDLKAVLDEDGKWCFTHKDDTPY